MIPRQPSPCKHSSGATIIVFNIMISSCSLLFFSLRSIIYNQKARHSHLVPSGLAIVIGMSKHV